MTQKHLRVLLVDDEKSLREPLATYLIRNFGFDVYSAENGEEALQLLDVHQGQFDVALIDDLLFTPPDGIELMRQIKARYPEIESIIFTGWGLDHRQRALKEGAFRYLEKPFDNLELVTLVRTAAQQVRLRAISREILSQRELEQIFAQITAATKSLVAADESMIVLFDAITKQLTVFPQQVATVLQGRHFNYANESLSREVIANSNVVVVSETENQKDDFAQLYEVGYRSFIGIPIPGEQGSLGVLFAYSRMPGQFDAGETVAVLRTLAGQAGLAIANAHAFQQVKAHSEHMDALVKVGQKLTQTTYQDEQLEIAWNYVHEQLGVTTFLVALYDERSDRLSFPLVYDNNVQQSLDAITLEKEKTEWEIPGHVIKAGEEIFWPTNEVKEEVCKAQGIVSRRFGDPCCSCFYFPLKLGNQVVGAISVQAYEPYAFQPVTLDACRALGNQLAVALENARLVTEAQNRAFDLATLLEQARLVSEIGQEVASNLDIDAFLESLFSRLTAIFEERQIPIYPGLVAYDASDKSLTTFKTRFYPDGTRPARVAITTSPGIMALVARSEKEYYSPDVSKDPNYNRLVESTKSEVALPVIYDGRLLAVLDLESTILNAFSPYDRQLLRTLAHHLAVTIHNVQQYNDLKETKGLIGKRTAVAWVGMVAAEWGHRVIGDAVTIRDTVELLESDLSSHLTTSTTDKLDRIKRKAQDILENQVSAPLHAEQGVEIVFFARLLEDRLHQLKERPRYASLSTKFLANAVSTTVRADPQWLKRVLDLLMDNAVRAMSDSQDKKLTITVSDAHASEVGQPLTANKVVKVQVQDNGAGIPEAIRQYLFIKPISGSKGSGVGLLLAQLILQTYGGDIYVDSTGADGTNMVFWLPAAQKKSNLYSI